MTRCVGLLLATVVVTAAELQRDLEYGRAGEIALRLDASVPEGEGPFPIAILIHGGGWSGGDKAGSDVPGNGADITPWFAPLTAAKFTWFSINYRLAPEHRWPACFDDVQTAIRWVKAHAADFKGDPQRIALFGHSAGGQLALLAAIRAGDDTRVQAVVGYAPVTDFEQELPVRGGLSPSLQQLHGRPHALTPEALALLRDTAPITHLRDKLPAFLLLHGDGDRTVPLQQSLNFQARARATSNTCDLIVLPGAGHGLLDWEKLSPGYAERMIAWLRTHLSQSQPPTSAPRLVTAGFPPTPPSVPSADGSGSDALSSGSDRLWYRQPAGQWTEALPLGAGRLGAMIFGGTAEERLQLNDDTLWTGRPHAYHREGAAAHLPELRRLLAEGKQREAEELAMQEFMSVPLRQESYQPLGDVLLSFPGHEAATAYSRDLDLDAAVAGVRYRVGEVGFSREAFASHPDQVIVQRIAADRPGAVQFTLRAAAPHAATQARTGDANTWLLLGRVRNDGTRFAAAVRVLVTGARARVTATRTGLVVTDADTATLLITAATSFVNFRDVSGMPETVALAALDGATARGPEALLARHQADHRSLYRRVALDLGTTAAAAQPTDERLLRARTEPDPALVTLLFNFGRYLLIASSRPGDQPANLQGNWNEQVFPSWGSKYTVNINTEMNYWPAEVANLAECARPLFAMIDDLVVSGRETARAHYGAPGWVLHHNTDLWRGTAPINHSNHGIWPTGGAWLTRHLWEHYLYGGDRTFLAQRAYPVMKEAAQFFLAYLVEDPKTGWLISGPSNSPEHGGLVMGPAMDHQIIRALFAATAGAAEILGVDADFAAELWRQRERIAPDQVGRHGQLQEWLEDKDDPKSTHRHVSHLWALFPGHAIRPQTPELFAAARQSLLFRGDDGTGWSLGWKVCFWARLLDGDHALKMLHQQLRPVRDHDTRSTGGGSYPNLFDAHPPFQIDGNFAATAGVCEMLLQSQLDEVVLLPALPGAWAAGSVRGLRARHGFELDFSWREGRVTEVTVRSTLGAPLTLRAGAHTVSLQPAAGATVRLNAQLRPFP